MLFVVVATTGVWPTAAMEAFGRTDANASAAPSSFAVPAIGSLHARYTLPPNASCELLVKVAASSVNPSDISPRIAPGDFPKIYGSDMAGTVLKLGSGCERLAVGDRVWGDVSGLIL